jgi:hypothetical protein
VLIYGEGVGKLRTIEGDEALIDTIKDNVVIQKGGGDDAAYRDFITASLASCEKLSAETRRMIRSDGKEDGAYVTLCAGELLWLNVNGREVKTTVTLPPNSIVSEKLP